MKMRPAKPNDSSDQRPLSSRCDLLRLLRRVVQVPNFNHRKQLVPNRVLFNHNKGVEKEIILASYPVSANGSTPVAVAIGLVDLTLW